MSSLKVPTDVFRDLCFRVVYLTPPPPRRHWESGGSERSTTRPARPGPLKQFADQLRPDDRVALEATGNALAIARIIRPCVKELVIVNIR